MISQEEGTDLPDFTLERVNLLLQGVYGDFLHQNNGLHLDGGVLYDDVWQCFWRRLAAQLTGWYATPAGAVGRRFMAILAAEWRGVLRRTWNSERPRIFPHVVLTKTLGICRDIEI